VLLKTPNRSGPSVNVAQTDTGTEQNMMPTDSVMARYGNTRGSRVNDPDLERYLREEYPGGMTVEALLAGTVRPNGGVRAAFVRFVKAVLRDFDRLKPAPAPMAP